MQGLERQLKLALLCRTIGWGRNKNSIKETIAGTQVVSDGSGSGIGLKV